MHTPVVLNRLMGFWSIIFPLILPFPLKFHLGHFRGWGEKSLKRTIYEDLGGPVFPCPRQTGSSKGLVFTILFYYKMAGSANQDHLSPLLSFISLHHPHFIK
jgi:hypothetical protein